MDKHILSFDLRALVKSLNRLLSETMPETARIATGGNARIIMFLARNRNHDIYQHTIEQKFCITRSTASRVLALMEKKGLIERVPVEHDARLKKIVLTDKADAIVSILVENGERIEQRLVEGFSDEERAALAGYVSRMRANIDAARCEFEERESADDGTAGTGASASDGADRAERNDMDTNETKEEHE